MTTSTSTPGSAHPMSLMKEIWWEAGARWFSSSSIGESARIPNTRAMTVCPIIFAALRRPRLRCRTILMKSSRKPTKPSPANRKSNSSAEALTPPPVSRLALK